MDCKYPNITVQLTGEVDGNAFSIIHAVRKALERGGVGKAERDQFFEEATSGDYDHLWKTVFQWVDVA